MALEDGAELAWHVQTSGLNADSFRAFEKDRAPRVAQIVLQEEVPSISRRSLWKKAALAAMELVVAAAVCKMKNVYKVTC